MIKHIFVTFAALGLFVSVINAQYSWGKLPSQGSGSNVAPSAYIIMNNLDSINASYSVWTPALSYFTSAATGKTNQILYHFNAVAADSIYLQVETRVNGDDSLIQRCFSVLIVGAADPSPSFAVFADSVVGDEYRIKIQPIKNGGGVSNARDCDLRVGFATDQMPYIAPKQEWNGMTK